MSRLALAYLFRRPVQVLAVLGVAIGLCALLTVNSVMNGLIEIDREDARGPLADILLIPDHSPSAERSTSWLDYQKALTQLQTPEGPIRAISPHLMAYSIMGLTGGESLLSRTSSSDVNGVQVVGIDPELELKTGGFKKSLQTSQIFPVKDPLHPFQLPSDDPFARPGVLIPDNLARALGFRLGETIELGALPPLPPVGDAPLLAHNARFTVVGTFRPSDYEMGMDRLYVHRLGEQGLRWNLLGEGGPDFSELLIELKPDTSPTAAKAAILSTLQNAALPEPGGPNGGALETWQERRSTYLSAIDNERRVTALVLFFIVVVAAFGLFATLSALVREKVRDLGVLSALGCSPLRRGALLFSTGALGSAVGSLLGYGAARWLAQGDRLERIMNNLGIEVFQSDLYVISGLPTLWIPEQASGFAWAAFALGCLFTLAPSVRALLLSPVEALRYE